jgi:hypothetical protein
LADNENTKPAPDLIVYEDTGSAAPVVYFDITGAYGTMHGTVEIELATRILVPRPNGSTDVKFLCSGRLRCSSNAAANLRNALDAALKMLEVPQPAPVAASKMN